MQKTRSLLSGATGAGIAAATILLFVVSWLFFPQSVSVSGLSGMLPFAAILVLVALGQTLVVQQGGVDLSVPGIMSLAGVIVAYGPEGASSTLQHAAIVLGIALLVGLLAGVLSGLLVTRLSVAPIVATLGLNTLLYGFNMRISGGTPGPATLPLVSFANIKIFGVTILAYIAVAAALCTILIVKKTAMGRRFEVAGANPRVGRAAGISVEHHQQSAYMASGGLSAAAGVLLAGIMQSPSAFQGNAYLMSSIAAVVLGGTSLLGGVGNFAATAIAAVFLSQLQLLVLTSGASIGVQYLFQGVAIVVGVAIYSVDVSKYIRFKTA